MKMRQEEVVEGGDQKVGEGQGERKEGRGSKGKKPTTIVTAPFSSWT